MTRKKHEKKKEKKNNKRNESDTNVSIENPWGNWSCQTCEEGEKENLISSLSGTNLEKKKH